MKPLPMDFWMAQLRSEEKFAVRRQKQSSEKSSSSVRLRLKSLMRRVMVLDTGDRLSLPMRLISSSTLMPFPNGLFDLFLVVHMAGEHEKQVPDTVEVCDRIRIDFFFPR